MQGELMSSLASLLPTLAVILILIALVLLWRASRSVWLMVAIVAEAIGLGFRALFFAAPEIMRSAPMLSTLWLLTGFVFGSALLAYAIEVTQRK
ncbi:MAG TPA: hypothetical protein VLK83_03975 [Rhodanobacteraceae bacterium]|jgi:hypothetical protein|nr:hypothetical protein [Rhodanobacteraceae bacterium]